MYDFADCQRGLRVELVTSVSPSLVKTAWRYQHQDVGSGIGLAVRSVNIHFKEDTFGVDNRSHIDLCMDARFKHLDGHTHSALVIPVRQSYCLEHEPDYTQSPLGRLIPLEHEIQTTRESYMFSYSTLQGDE